MSMRIKTANENSEVNYSLQKILNTPGGLEKLALEKLPPFIRDVRDYEGFARKVLFWHEISEDDTHPIKGQPYVYYPKDLESTAAIYADDGEIPQLMVDDDGVDVGIFTVASDDTTINLKKLLVQKYDYLERIKDLSGQAVAKAEDSRLLALVNLLVDDNSGQDVSTDATELVKDDLVDLRKAISQHDLPTTAFVMNQYVLDDILKWDDSDFDELSRREVIETGVRYTIWGDTKLIPSRVVPSTEVYAFSEKEFVGRMPVLKDIASMLTEGSDDRKLEKGLFLYEFIGMYLASHKAVAKLTISTE